MIHTQTFHPDELVKLDESRFVILGCGGPLMEIVSREGDDALCEFVNQNNKLERHVFPIACLRKLVRFS